MSKNGHCSVARTIVMDYTHWSDQLAVTYMTKSCYLCARIALCLKCLERERLKALGGPNLAQLCPKSREDCWGPLLLLCGYRYLPPVSTT